MKRILALTSVFVIMIGTFFSSCTSFGSVVFADAWWGYQGLMSSGLNPWVGGGAAAVGSACACLH